MKFIKPTTLDIAMLFGIIFAVCFAGFSTFNKNCEKLETEVLRLHILANSDEDFDQNLKYKVRDRLLSEFDGIFTGCESVLDAEIAAAENMDYIKEIAADEIRDNGFNYDVSSTMTNMFFDTRNYKNITMPAGDYDAIRVVIGEGKGKNWWCVMYPALCIKAAENNRYFNEEQSKIIESKKNVSYKFAILEWIKKYFGK